MGYTFTLDASNSKHKWLEVSFYDVKFQLHTSYNYSSNLRIIKSKDAGSDVNVADYFMEFIQLLYRIGISDFAPRKIDGIEFHNMTISSSDIKIILYLCEIAKGDEKADKSYRFENCIIPKEIPLAILPCEDNRLYIKDSVIEDFASLNGFVGDRVDIINTKIQNYTGFTTIHCTIMKLRNVRMNYSLFFIKTRVPDLEALTLQDKHFLTDKDFAFLSNFYNLTYLETNARVEDTKRIDMLKKLRRCFGVFEKQNKARQGKYSWIPYFGIVETLQYYGIYPPSYEEYIFWKNRIENETPETVQEDITWAIRQAAEVGKALATQNSEGLPDLRFLLENNLIEEKSTRRLELDLEKEELEEIEGIKYYSAAGIYIPDKIKPPPEESPFTSLLNRDAFMTILDYQNGKYITKTLDTAGKFCVSGSLADENLEEIRKQIVAAQSQSHDFRTISKRDKIRKYFIKRYHHIG